MTTRLAFAGTGHISRVHAAAALSIPDIALAAVVNHRPESRADFASQFGIERQYDTVDSMLADGGVDALVVSTPNALHAPQSIAALTAGLHVMVEKPMALNAAECEAMLSASESSGAKLMVAHCWRFDDEVNWLKRQIDSGVLGDIVHTRGFGVHVNWGPGGWFTDASLAGGGALADMGIHAIDTARYLLGDPLPTSVYARISTKYGDYAVDDCGLIHITWDNGAHSIVESGWWWSHADGPEAGTQVHGTRAYGQLFPTRLETPDREAETVDILESGYAHPREEHCPQDMYDRQMAHFIDCVRGDRRPSPDGNAGAVNMRIVDAALQSSQSNQVITV